MFRQIVILTLSLLVISTVSAQTIVRTSEELQAVLTQDKEVGVVLLDGDWFHVEEANVKMGGKILPYRNRKPLLVGFQQSVNKSTDTEEKGGYWTAQIKGYGPANYIFLDDSFKAIERAKKVSGQEYMHIKATDLQRMDRETRTVRIKVPPEYSSILNKSEGNLKNAMLKVGYWFVQMNIYYLKSDDTYLYGQIDNAYHYDLLDFRPYADVKLSFFNFPLEDGGIFLDGNDVLHVPAYCSTARMCCSNNILTLSGDRLLTIEGIAFTGSMKPIVIEGSNKHFKKCSFINCGSGIYCDYGVANREGKCSVKYCNFENLYNNNAVTFVGCDDIVISNNEFYKTGIVNQGGCVISVGGNRFLVEHNSIKRYSYIGIYAGISRDNAAAQMTGRINDNLVDNIDNWGQSERQLTDGGGIYVITHTDGVTIENNIVRNIGYDGCELWGIYLDDGAYNCTVRRNLVYNLWPGQSVMTARYVDECERSCMNNVFEDNIFIGPCKMAGNRKGFGSKTVIHGNYIAGELITEGNEYVSLEKNKYVSTTIRKDGKIVVNKGERIKKRGFTRSIKKLINS